MLDLWKRQVPGDPVLSRSSPFGLPRQTCSTGSSAAPKTNNYRGPLELSGTTTLRRSDVLSELSRGAAWTRRQ